MANKTLHLVSLGCNKNLVDAEVMLYRLKSHTLTHDPSQADLIIVNTCGFIEAAKQESIQTILDLHSLRKKNSTLLVLGCLSQRYKDDIKNALPEVDIFSGLGDYARINKLIENKQSHFSDDVFLISNEKRRISNSLTHAFIKISEGCNQRCSFCAIPSFRGSLKSRNSDFIHNEIAYLQAKGYYDFSLIAQDSSSYMLDQNKQNALEDLVRSIDKKTQNPYAKFRILYLYPTTTKLSLIKTIQSSPSFAPYFDMPIQHASDKMLKVMKRGANMKKIRTLLYAMKDVKNAWLRTAFIIGHPHEKKEDFLAILDLINEDLFDSISVFAYSKEENTASFKMRMVAKNRTIERMNIIEELVEKKQNKSMKAFINKTLIASIVGESEQSEHIIEAKNLDFSSQIDPPILITQSDYALDSGDLVEVFIYNISPPFLLANVVKIIKKYKARS